MVISLPFTLAERFPVNPFSQSEWELKGKEILWNCFNLKISFLWLFILATIGGMCAGVFHHGWHKQTGRAWCFVPVKAGVSVSHGDRKIKMLLMTVSACIKSFGAIGNLAHAKCFFNCVMLLQILGCVWSIQRKTASGFPKKFWEREKLLLETLEGHFK